MMLFASKGITAALIGPDGEIVRIQHNVDITGGTKQGYRWLPVERSEPPPITADQVRVRGDYQIDGAVVRRKWTIREKTEAEKTSEAHEVRAASIDLVDLEQRVSALEQTGKARS